MSSSYLGVCVHACTCVCVRACVLGVGGRDSTSHLCQINGAQLLTFLMNKNEICMKSY